MDPAGKVALVTGGARRVGRALSLALGSAGADVVVNYNTSAAEAADLVRELERMGRRALALQADVSRRADVHRLIEHVRTEFNRLDILVNSASSFESAPFLEIEESDWDRVLAVNLKGPFLMMQAGAPLMRAQPPAIIVNLADLSAFQPWPSYAHHAVSKAGLVQLTRVAARALAPAIRVNCIAPGTVLPPEGYTGMGSDGTSDRRLVSPAGQPDDVARALLFLVQSEFMTGQTVVVDGGRLLL
ncbi:MAG: SDR family NAD(P)-dependent oxidoreductase [Longimicrobiales bacterium]